MKKLALLSTVAALTLMFASDVSAQGATDPAAAAPGDPRAAAGPTPGAAVTDVTDTDRTGTDAYRIAPYGAGTRDADGPGVGTRANDDRAGARDFRTNSYNMNTRTRAAAAGNNNNVDWGWLGLIGLFGLVGLRGRNQQQTGGTNR